MAKTNRKMDDYYRKKPVQSDVTMPLIHAEKEKKQGGSNQAHALRIPPIEEEKKTTGLFRVQIIEESKSEAFMIAKVDDPALRREQMAVDLLKSKRQELISKRRNPPLSEIVKELEETNRRLD